MMNSCCRRCDNGLCDVCNGVNCIINGISKGVCCGVNVLTNMGCSLMTPPCCAPKCCGHRPRPHPPACTCTCKCACRCDCR